MTFVMRRAAFLPLLLLPACVPYGFTPAVPGPSPSLAASPAASPAGTPAASALPASPVALSAKGTGCVPASPVAPSPPPSGAPAPPPFSYRVVPGEPFEGFAQASLDGTPFRFQAEAFVVDFEAPDVEQVLPNTPLPGVLAHQELIGPVAQDFDLVVLSQRRIPLDLTATPGPDATSRSKLQASFLVAARHLDAEPLDGVQADAVALGLDGAWSFQGRAAAATFGRMNRLLRRRACYGVTGASLNVVVQ